MEGGMGDGSLNGRERERAGGVGGCSADGRSVARMAGRRKTGREKGRMYLKSHTLISDTYPTGFCGGRS